MKINIFILIIMINVNILYALSIEEAYERVLVSNSDLKNIKYKYDASIYNIEDAKSDKNIQLSWNSSFTREKDYKTDQSVINQERYSVILDKKLYNNDIDNNILQSELKSKISKIEYEKKKQELFIELSTKYLELYRYMSQKKLYVHNLNKSKLRFRKIEKLLTIGLASKIDYLEAKVNLQESQNKLNEIIYKTDKLKDNLDDFIMLKSSNIQISNIDNIISIIDNYIKTNNKISVYNSFDTLLAKMQSDMEYLNLIKLRKSYYPTIDLSTSYNVINSENKYDNEQLLMGQINISGIFYKGGSISYRKKEITNLYKSSLEQIKITIRDDKYKTREYLMNIKSNLSKYKLTNETLKSSKLHLKYIKEAYEHGLKDLTQLLDAEGKIISLRSDIINIGIETILEFIKLKYIEKDINKDFIVIFK